jgi:2-polyprenyl-3-methyl-5-hydroxy-6-metoxy-1,4-benzoquinol methylase
MTPNRPAVVLHDPASETTSHVAWEEIPCPLCAEVTGSPLLEAPDPLPPAGEGLVFAVVRCARCGLSYTNPRPTEHSISRFYPADYRPHRRASKMRQSRRVSPLWSRVLGRPCSERRGVLPWPGPGRLLDFGCGAGTFLKTMADQGWQVTGLDAAVGAVQHVREQHGLTALVGTLPHAELRPSSFDVVTMWHSLEHVHHPLAILREAHRLLIPGGKIIVATPNIESMPFRVFGRSWFGLDLPRHLTHFTPRTLSAMLQAAGFRPDPVRQMRHSDWLRSSAKLALRQGTGGLAARMLGWKLPAKMAAWMCYAVRASDCMICVAERPA